MIPAMTPYIGSGANGVLDGGYYCKTRENRPLIGRLPVELRCAKNADAPP
jgi:hypothetical protein